MITLVYGAPCSGKTTWALGTAQGSDVVIDADRLAQALGSKDSHDHQGTHKALAQSLREHATSQARRLGYNTYVISASPTAIRDIPHDTSRLVDPGIEVCKQRAKANGRPRWTYGAIDKFYAELIKPHRTPSNRVW